MTTLYVELWQVVRSYKLWKVFFHSYHVDSIGHDCQKDLDYFPKIALKYANVAELLKTMSEASLFHHLGLRNKSMCNSLFVFITLQYVLSFTLFSLVQRLLNMTNNFLETWRRRKLIINLGIVKFFLKFIKQFLNYFEICRRGPNNIQKW